VIDPDAIPLGRVVRVRRFRREDVTGQYVAWLNDADVVRFSNQRFVTHSLESCNRYFASFSGGDNLFLSIRDAADDRAVGTMTVYRSLPHQTADIGIMIGDRTTRGKGYGTEAWRLVVEWLAGSGELRKITAGTMQCNLGMIHLMERAGMTLEAVRKEQELLEGMPMDLVYYARFC